MEKSIVKATESTVQVPDIRNLRALASDLLNSGLFQGVKNVAGAVTVIQAGIELGIPPVAALNTMAVINGRLSMEAKALLAIAQKRAGVTWHVVKEDDKGCEIIFSRPGWPDTSSSFTEEEAQVAGLLGKNNWKLYRKDMLFARAASRGIRRIAPDALLGLYSIEEMRDVPNLSNGHAPAIAVVPIAEPVADPIREELEANGQVVNEVPEKIPGKFDYLDRFKKARARLGDALYYEILDTFRYKHANQVPVEVREKILIVMNQAREDMTKSSKKEAELF